MSVDYKELCSSFPSFHYFALERYTGLSDFNHWKYFVSLIQEEDFIDTRIDLSISDGKKEVKCALVQSA